MSKIQISASETTRDGSRLSVQQMVDESPLGRRRVLILVIAFITMMLEGIEIQMWGFIYPQIVVKWGTSLETITTIVTAGVIALTVGAGVAGPLADRFGRKVVIVVGTAVFGIATLGGAAAADEVQLGIARCVACFGLGAVMPMVITLVGEVMPSKRRPMFVGIAFTGFPLGTTVTASVAGSIIPTLGWQALLGIGGLVALLILPAIIWGLLESVVFLARNSGRRERLERALRMMVPGFDPSSLDIEGASSQVKAERGAIRAILSRDHFLKASLLWFCYFVAAGVVYIFLNYLPLIAATSGSGPATAGLAIAMMGIFGVVGSLSIGFLMTRFGRYLIVGLFFTLAAVAVWTIAVVDLTAGVLIGASAVIGLAVIGLNSGMNSFSTTEGVFPDEGRATGVAWMHGFGKAGSIVSGIAGGVMLSAGWGIGQIYLALGFPLALGALAITSLWSSARHRTVNAP